MANIHQEIIDDFDYLLSEKGNVYISLRKVKWSETSGVKLDLRKYTTNSDGSEQMMKGCSFDDETADSLAEVLVDNNYGNTRTLIDSLKTREGFEDAYCRSINNEPEEDTTVDDNEDYYDIREMMG